MDITQVGQSTIDNIDFDNLEFGRTFTDHMLICDFDGEKWGDFRIEPVKPIPMHPATSVLHYGQAIFEGLKAYKNDEGLVNIFRLHDNLDRLNKSAVRMQMPQIDAAVAKEAIKQYVSLEKEWVPNKSQGSLYVRPFMIASDNTLRALSSKTYQFIVIACPVGFYYNKPLNVYLEKMHRRAARGGVGYAKAAGNYAASFYPTELARSRGYDQILWTDTTSNYTIEELGSANFFYVKEGVIFTPQIHDSILKGITRDTIIKLAKGKGLTVVEGSTEAENFKEDLSNGVIDCMFATGTAAAITYINAITIDDSVFKVESDSYQPVIELKKNLDNVKFLEDRTNDSWNVIIE